MPSEPESWDLHGRRELTARPHVSHLCLAGADDRSDFRDAKQGRRFLSLLILHFPSFSTGHAGHGSEGARVRCLTVDEGALS